MERNIIEVTLTKGANGKNERFLYWYITFFHILLGISTNVICGGSEDWWNLILFQFFSTGGGYSITYAFYFFCSKNWYQF